MRAILVVSLVAFLYPAAALAQGATAPAASPPAADKPSAASGGRRGGADISRAEYLEKAKQNAEKRFDKVDTNHDGVLTIEERRAARGKRRSQESQ